VWTPDSTAYAALVSGRETAGLDSVIIQFTYFILMLFFAVCFAACQSTATAGSAPMDTKIIARSEKESEEGLKYQGIRIVSNPTDAMSDYNDNEVPRAALL